MAKKHNLSHTYDKNKKLNVLHQLKGKYKGYPIHIFEQMEGQRKGQHLATHIVFLNSPFNFEFTISKENLINKVEKKLNKQVVLFNDNALDNTFWLKSNDEIKFKRLLNTRKTEALKSIENNLHFKIENNGNELSYTIYENLYSPKAFKDLEFVMDFMVLLLKS